MMILFILMYTARAGAAALEKMALEKQLFNRDDTTQNYTQTGPPAPADLKYCSRAYHSATVRDNTLYMMGGELDYINTSVPTVYQAFAATDVWALDLTKSFNCSDAPEHKSYPYPSYLPIRSCGGALWRDPAGSDAIYYYGGERPGFQSISNSTIPPPAIYEFDPKREEFVGSKSPANIEGRSCGSYAQDNDGFGYYLGGLRGLISDPNFENPPEKQQDTLVKMDLTDGGKSYEELDTANIWKFGTNVGGDMVYIDSIGAKGILVAFGGVSISPDLNWSWDLPTDGNYNDMNSVYIYDIDSKKWFSQKTYGMSLQPRSQDCAVVVKAQDNSSIQIYTYGGYNRDRLFDQPHVLSLPTFTWLPAGPVGTLGRFVMTCNVVGNRQILMTGGRTEAIGLDGVLQAPWTCVPDEFYKVFDMATHEWTNYYNASAEPYEVNEVLLSITGGAPTGGATQREPKAGWDDANLGKIFEKYLPPASSSGNPPPNNPPSSSSPSSNSPHSTQTRAGVIAGATIGSVAFLFLCISAIWLRFRRRDKHRPDIPYMPPAFSSNLTGRTPQAELPPTVPPSIAWAGMPTAAYRANVDACGRAPPTNYSPATGRDIALGITEASSPSSASPDVDSPYFANRHLRPTDTGASRPSGLLGSEPEMGELYGVRTPMAELPLPSPGELPVSTPAAGANIRSIGGYLSAGSASGSPAAVPTPESGGSGGTALGAISSEGSTPGSGRVLLR